MQLKVSNVNACIVLVPTVLHIGVGMNAVPGGTFPLPNACASMLQRIPPPDCYKVQVEEQLCHCLCCLPQGPFVQVDELLTLLQKVDLDQQSSTGNLDLVLTTTV